MLGGLLRAILARSLFMWGSLHRNFGNNASFAREHHSAVKRFSQAYRLDPAFREARLARAILYYRELNMAEAGLADLDALLLEDPDYGPALLNRAMAAQQLGRYAQALADLERYLGLPAEDDEYAQIAARTAAALRDIVAELPADV
ncbi:MAG: hypothetical protein ACRDHL_05585 [Candidatus Promineifilaceae bacterium]